MINKKAELESRILLYNAIKGILRTKIASMQKTAEPGVPGYGHFAEDSISMDNDGSSTSLKMLEGLPYAESHGQGGKYEHRPNGGYPRSNYLPKGSTSIMGDRFEYPYPTYDKYRPSYLSIPDRSDYRPDIYRDGSNQSVGIPNWTNVQDEEGMRRLESVYNHGLNSYIDQVGNGVTRLESLPQGIQSQVRQRMLEQEEAAQREAERKAKEEEDAQLWRDFFGDWDPQQR